VTGPSANNSYNNILAKLGWPIKNGELSSQLAGQQWVKSLKGLTFLAYIYDCTMSLENKVEGTLE
jgi:hypothetical protein